MTEQGIRLASNEADIDAIRQLCRDALCWELETFPHLKDEILTHSEPCRWERFLSDLPELYARDRGAMLLAEMDDMPAGCILYSRIEPGIVEIRRLFVARWARGKGLGTGLVGSCLRQAKADGYRAARLTSARFFDAALKLYREHGFRTCAAYIDMPPDLQRYAVFMDRPL